MRGDAGGGTDGQRRADRVGIALHAESRDVREATVERRHRVPEVALRAAEAGMTRADRPARAGIPQEDRTGRERRGPFAAHVIEAPPLARRIVVERLDELTGVEVGAARALVVDARPVGEQRPAVVVELGHAPEGEDVHDRRRDYVADRRAARDVHHRLVLDNGVDADSARRIGSRRLDVAPVRARTNGDHRLRVARRLFQDRLGGATTDRRVNPAVVERNRARDHQQVLPLVLRHRALQRGLGLVAGGGHDVVLVVE